MINPYILLTALIILITSTVGGYFKGRSDANASWQAETANKIAEVRLEDKRLQEKSNVIITNRQEEKSKVSADLANALVRLRKRPERVPTAASSTCEGTTGAQLSAEDAEFLTREAARADELRAALSACQDWSETVTSHK